MSWMHATSLFSVLSNTFLLLSSFRLMSLWCISSDFVLTLFLVLMLISFFRLILMLLFSFGPIWSHPHRSMLFFCSHYFVSPFSFDPSELVSMLLFFSHLTSVILVCLILMFPSHLALSWATICKFVSSCLFSSHQVSFLLNAFLSCFDTFLLSSSIFVSFLFLLALSHFDASCLIPFLVLF